MCVGGEGTCFLIASKSWANNMHVSDLPSPFLKKAGNLEGLVDCYKGIIQYNSKSPLVVQLGKRQPWGAGRKKMVLIETRFPNPTQETH